MPHLVHHCFSNFPYAAEAEVVVPPFILLQNIAVQSFRRPAVLLTPIRRHQLVFSSGQRYGLLRLGVLQA